MVLNELFVFMTYDGDTRLYAIMSALMKVGEIFGRGLCLISAKQVVLSLDKEEKMALEALLKSRSGTEPTPIVPSWEVKRSWHRSKRTIYTLAD